MQVQNSTTNPNFPTHNPPYTTTLEEKSCSEEGVKSPLPRYGLENRVAYFKTYSYLKVNTGEGIVEYKKEYTAIAYNSMAKNEKIETLTKEKSKDFLSTDKFDVIEIYEDTDSPAKKILAAKLYRILDKTYAVFSVGGPVEFLGNPPANEFCIVGWNPELVIEAGITIHKKRFHETPKNITPPPKGTKMALH